MSKLDANCLVMFEGFHEALQVGMEFRRCEDQALVMKDGDLLGKWWVETWLEGNFRCKLDVYPPPTGDVSAKCLGIHPIKVWYFFSSIWALMVFHNLGSIPPPTGDVSGK